MSEIAEVTDFPTQDPSWDLDSIFEGGVQSDAFENYVERLERRVDELGLQADELVDLASCDSLEDDVRIQWTRFVEEWEAVAEQMRQSWAYSRAVASTHTDNPVALRLPTKLNEPSTELDRVVVTVKARLRGVEDEIFEELIASDGLERCQLYLQELREEAERAMEPDMEGLAVALNRDGLHAWGQLYDQVSATLTVRIDHADRDAEDVSVGQAKNLLSNRDRALRSEAHEGLDRAWRSRAPTFAAALNAIIGAEQTLYDRRGGDELTYPLVANRIQRETLDAMMTAADQYQELLGEYRRAKASLLGLETLEWFDRMAPVGEETGDALDYQSAQEFIAEQVSGFSDRMGDFYRYALANQWVEAEDRPGKAQGGYCTSFPEEGETRIFMTYGETASSAKTLAHELGHAYHGWVLRDLGAFEKKLPMGLAETASTLAEALVEQAALEKAGPAQRLKLLDERLQRADAFLINIPARYRLERRMHTERRKGQLDESLLSEITTEIFEDHYGPSVASVDDLYWASKLHFFITRLPFYNFPYTFGYLFSRAVGKRAAESGPEYAGVVDDLLRQTGRMTAEEIGERYLDADLTTVEFWRDAAASTREDVREFVELAEQSG